MKRKTIKAVKAGMIGLLCFLAASGIVSGYSSFSGDLGMKRNPISVVKGEQGQAGGVTVLEERWDAKGLEDESYALDMSPGQSLEKDPKVQSNVDYPGWVFVTVEIPTVQALMEKEDSSYEHVTFIGEGTDYEGAFEVVVPGINTASWQLYSRNAKEGCILYVYGYKTPLEAHGITETVFDTVTIPRFKRCDGCEGVVRVKALIVQEAGSASLEEAGKKLGLAPGIETTFVNPTA